MTDKDLDRLLEECRRQTGGIILGWELIFHIDGPGGPRSGYVTLCVRWAMPGRAADYWTRTVSEPTG